MRYKAVDSTPLNTYVRCTIRDIDQVNQIAQTVDQIGKIRMISLTRTMGKSPVPAVGEQWIISNQFGGTWVFTVMINPPVAQPTPTTLDDVIAILQKFGLAL